ncbi:MAG: rhomboid family intramembrane serine protease [Planctomycetes bacterium]|nr:rhomboid family intramembrane serine protease [Planctomycetota bacterium]
MFLPIRTSICPRRTPYTNYALIAINIFIFLISYWPHTYISGGRQVHEVLRNWAQPFMLHPDSPEIWQFVTYAFLHGSMLHIFGNMFFLYLFGNAINDKMGNVGYICLYLAGAVFSGLGHALISSNPVLGASGAVAAITGAYLVLFPKAIITVIYWFFFIGTFDLHAYFFIAIKMIIIDNILYRGADNVAYEAHLSGYAFGIIATYLLLAVKLMPGDHFDLWSLTRQWNRRRQFRDISNGPGPNQSRKWVKAKEVKSSAQMEKEEMINDFRAKISSLIYQKNISEAANTYLDLTQIDIDHVLPRQQQLDIANQLMSMSEWEQASRAYELFLTRYQNCQYSEQVELMLGVIYARYLHKPEKAVKYLKAARKKITDRGQINMCDEELNKLAMKGHE